MSILINKSTQTLVQGITGRDGSFHARAMRNDGTKIIGGVTPGKGGDNVDGMPVYDSVADALREHRIDATVIFVPARFAAGAIREAADNNIALIVCITEGIPILEMIEVYHYVYRKGVRLIGPNCPGLITPGQSKIGIMPYAIHTPGLVGVISRSGTLTYEVVHALSRNNIGQSTAIGIGGDPIVGSGFIDVLDLFERDANTRGIVLIGEIGGEDEERAAEYIKKNVTKPVVAFIAGRTAPEGKRMGHAGAIVSGNAGTADVKIDALQSAGVAVAHTPEDIPHLMRQALAD